MDAIPAGDYYRPVTEELCQGDIFGCVPLVRMREQPRVLKTVMLSPKRSVYEFDEAFDANVAAPADRKNRNVLSISDFTSGILFTHDCEIDKGATKDLTLAIIRPFDSTVLQDMEAAQRIRQNEKFALYYLPSGAEGWAECYVDFRRLVSVDTRMLRSVYPLRRLSEAARDGMMFQFFKYLTRREVNGANTTLVPPE